MKTVILGSRLWERVGRGAATPPGVARARAIADVTAIVKALLPARAA